MTIPPGWDLPDALRALVGQSSGRQRALLHEGNLLIVLHRVPGQNDLKREGVLFWRAPPVLPKDETVPGESAPAEWKSTSAKDGLPSLRLHLLEYERAVAELEKKYQSAQKSGGARELFEILQAVAPIYRAATNLGNALQSAGDLLPDAVELLPLRDAAGDFERAAELLQIDAKNALDYQIARGNDEAARLALQAAKAGQRLNVIAAITLPLTALAGVFGMNLPNGLEGAPPALFWGIFAGGAAFGIGLSLVIAKSK